MNRDLVESSQIRSIGYDDAEHILEVEFTRGGVFQYLDVPSGVYMNLMNAPSKGKFLHETIKPSYRFVKTGSSTPGGL